MAKKEESGSPGWSASFFIQTTEDVARAVADAAAAAIAVHSPRPSVVFQSKEENSGSQLRRLRHQVSRVLKGFSPPVETKKITYNPEVLTSQKRQWASLQLQSLDHRSFKESTRLFESIVVVGLHPNCDIQALQKLVFARRCEGSGKFRSALSGHFNSRVEPCLEPQVLFAFPPEKQLPLKYKDLLSFCFPGGVEVHAVEKTPSMSELNEILLGQEHLKQSDLSFVFRLQVADNSTLYGCCVLVDEIVQKPSRLVSMMSDNQPSNAPLSRHVLTTQRCYCLLSRLPFFELHFSVLNSIFTEERFERLTQSIDALDLGIIEMDTELGEVGNGHRISSEDVQEDGQHEADRDSQLDNSSEQVEDGESGLTDVDIEETSHSLKGKSVVDSPASDIFSRDIPQPDKEPSVSPRNSDVHDICSYNSEGSKQMSEKTLPDAVWPLLRHRNYESSESSSSLQGSPCEGRLFRSDTEDAETDETSSSGREDFMDHSDVLEWAKANKLGSLQIICEYYRLKCPAKGSTLNFHPLEHLQPLEFTRPDARVLHIDGSLIDLESCSTSLERAEVYNELLAEEEAAALSVWAISSICGALRLENVLTMFAGALLEKQIVVVCSNLGILAASVLSIVPLIRPFRWQSFLMPVLPNDMLDFLDAPVPYIVGVKNKTSELSKMNSVLVDLNKNQVRSPSMPHLPRQKELYASLSPYYAKLVGESYLGKRRPFYDCTDVQVDAAKGFLNVLRTYLNSLCSNLRSHTITNVQSNDDKVSLLLKDSFIDSFHYRDRPFMKLFVDTQLFSVHTDLNLSFYQKE